MTQLTDSPVVLEILRMLDKFTLKSGDIVEATITASKDDVKIMFKIVKNKKPTPPSGKSRNK